MSSTANYVCARLRPSGRLEMEAPAVGLGCKTMRKGGNDLGRRSRILTNGERYTTLARSPEPLLLRITSPHLPSHLLLNSDSLPGPSLDTTIEKIKTEERASRVRESKISARPGRPCSMKARQSTKRLVDTCTRPTTTSAWLPPREFVRLALVHSLVYNSLKNLPVDRTTSSVGPGQYCGHGQLCFAAGNHDWQAPSDTRDPPSRAPSPMLDWRQRSHSALLMVHMAHRRSSMLVWVQPVPRSLLVLSGVGSDLLCLNRIILSCTGSICLLTSISCQDGEHESPADLLVHAHGRICVGGGASRPQTESILGKMAWHSNVDNH
ncbi:hypothetical protein GGX14DRAFT_563192 [Mycena pura]|uniref:Uncharacterized protein n=1 Tax=Mycena pura TaxID=153505 RepID=A0AAD6VMD4_9AGAR|nr:hypothetical protein GGX14DRAFT_563192 [Mycena pura]